VQWRSLDLTGTLGKDDGWRDPKRLIKRSSVISKKGLNPKFQYQVRVRARLGQCLCGMGSITSVNEYGAPAAPPRAT
jgi:hypothetical protein